MRIKLFETFNEPSFQKISYEEFNKKLDSRSRESWSELEIEKVTGLFRKQLGWKNCKVGSSKALFPESFIVVGIFNEWGLLSDSVYIIKQEDEWFLAFRHPGDERFECDQFSGLEECIKKLINKK